MKATYRDGEGGEKAAYVRSKFRVREMWMTEDNDAPTFDGDDADTRKIPENADVRDAVGSPVVATDPNKADSGRLTYSIVVGNDAASFSIHEATGQIRVAAEVGPRARLCGQPRAKLLLMLTMLSKLASATQEDGIYVITVMVTDPSGDSGGSTDTKVVVITATDVDEVPSVKAGDGRH